jgi:hypothetical protein
MINAAPIAWFHVSDSDKKRYDIRGTNTNPSE